MKLRRFIIVKVTLNNIQKILVVDRCLLKNYLLTKNLKNMYQFVLMLKDVIC